MILFIRHGHALCPALVKKLIPFDLDKLKDMHVQDAWGDPSLLVFKDYRNPLPFYDFQRNVVKTDIAIERHIKYFILFGTSISTSLR